MTLPDLPTENDDPWFEKRSAFDEAVRQAIDEDLPDSISAAQAATLESMTTGLSDLSTSIDASRSEQYLTTGQDFNTMLDPNMYLMSTTAMAASTNRPSAIYGHLRVYAGISTGTNKFALQRFTEGSTSTGRTYERIFDTSGWSDWRKIALTSDIVTPLPPFYATDLVGTKDLNTLTAPGVYICRSNAQTTAANHWPLDGWAGYIEVIPSAMYPTSYVLQRATGLVSDAGSALGRSFSRTFYGGNWQSWVETTPKRDSGVRDVAGLFDPSWTVAAATLQRTGDMCTLSTTMKSVTATGTVQGFVLPVGFRPGGSAYLQAPRYTTGVSFHGLLNIAAPSGLIRGFGTVASNTASYATIVWPTPDAFPTTLPGMPA